MKLLNSSKIMEVIIGIEIGIGIFGLLALEYVSH